MNEISLRLAGGLGNQLFQLAAALYICDQNRSNLEKIYIDARFLSKYNSSRHYEMGFISKFFPNIEVGPSKFFLCRFANRYRIARLLGGCRLGHIELISSTEQLKKISQKKQFSKIVILDGYFQNPDILFNNQTREKIRNSLLMEKIQLFNSVKSGKRCTGLHIRRGDYVSNKSASRTFREIPLDYYVQALKRLPDDNRILIFSDDHNLAQSFSEKINGLNVSDLNLSLEDEFCLLMACDDYVIANSTFSWWAAYLGRQNDSQIISPTNWYVNRKRNANNPLLLDFFYLLDI
ncbi:MAG: alpha-1,2-fucosyltransferase [Limnobacter sp.]|uniref:alpha-1,2-fucosyltransferase n=1 Tax=Limnobacter sp. TaxID=2003368 RepID=UPI0032EB8C36